MKSKDRFIEIEVKPVKCSLCIHYIKGLKCKAFKLIPKDIFNETKEHNRVIKGQIGTFIFELKTE